MDGQQGSLGRVRWVGPGLAIGLSMVSVAYPPVSMLAILAVVVIGLSTDPRARRWVFGLGIPLLIVALSRFILSQAALNIVIAGQKSAEEMAVSRLREILWAEDNARLGKVMDADRDGVGEYVPLDVLLNPSDDGARLKPGQFEPVEGVPGVYRSHGYLFRVYLPNDVDRPVAGTAQVNPPRASTRWCAYAWPAGEKFGGHRTFFIDHEERICETVQPRYVGVYDAPTPGAALSGGVFGGEPCGPDVDDGGVWKRWKRKRSRSDVVDDVPRKAP